MPAPLSGPKQPESSNLTQVILLLRMSDRCSFVAITVWHDLVTSARIITNANKSKPN